MRVLGIETSCDETAAAVVSGRRVLSDVVHSQVALHAEFGGVVPELASRDHLKNVAPVLEAALAQAQLEWKDIDAIAVTCRPGLSGALLVGTQVGSALSFALDRPLVGVDHLVGHLLAVHLEFEGVESPPAPAFPYLGLLASGGHTALYEVRGPLPEDIRELGGTRDDAAGEAYDKVAKLLGLGYPGGPIVDRLAREGNPDGVELAAPMPRKDLLEFSFSGLKTNVMRWVAENGLPKNDSTLRDLCAAFQRRVTEALVKKAVQAAKREGLERIVLAGGVAANSELRRLGRQLSEAAGIEFVVPPFRACTDNAAMIAYAGAALLAAGRDDRGKLEISPRTSLPRATRKGGGVR